MRIAPPMKSYRMSQYDKDMDPGLLDGHDRTSKINVPPKQTFEHIGQHADGPTVGCMLVKVCPSSPTGSERYCER